MGPPFVLCPSYVTATKIHSRDDRKKSWLEKKNVSGAPLGSLAAKISPKWWINEWIWERGGLACALKVLLVKTAGKNRERNYSYKGMCTHPSANRAHGKSSDATRYHRDVTGTATFPDQMLICFPNKDISCKHLFVNTSCFHCYPRNISDFQLISHHKVLMLDMDLPAGMPLSGCQKGALSYTTVTSVAYRNMAWWGV